jgi:hypothetical protein
MSVSELEQAALVHSERRMVITSFACDTIKKKWEEEYAFSDRE